MNAMFSWPVFFGSLATGVIGVLISVASTIAYNNYAERRRIKVDCTRQLFRHSLSENEFFKAFSEVPLIFSDSPTVLAAHEKVQKSKNLVGEEMYDFIICVAKEMKMANASRAQLGQRYGLSKKS